MKQIFFKFFINNFITNFFIRLFGLEKFVYQTLNPYLSFKPNASKTTQENAGYSNRPEINEVLEKSKADLNVAVSTHCKPGDAILDLGCGPGMYLSLFKNINYQLVATDINSTMLSEAKKIVPNANYIHGDFMEILLDRKFNFIYCIGVLIYVPRYRIENFLKKIHDSLENNGVLFLNYPHALSWLDTVYNDLTYIQYSPRLIEKIIEPYFTIILHQHAFDGRKIGLYDTKPYLSLNPDTDRTYKNSYLLIAQKK